MSQELSPETRKVVEQIQKLLNLAAKNPNEHEAAAATAKAQELLAKHNLDAAAVAGADTGSGKREELKVEGGFYKHLRDLWEAVADLNFCVYWSQPYTIEGIRTRYERGLPPIKTMITKRRHMLVGRIVNTRSTVAMAQYLEGAIERIVNEKCPDDQTKYGNWATSFRKGCTARVVEMIRERRQDYLVEEEKKAKAAARAASGASTSTAITVASFAQAEQDANNDFMYGEGFSAKVAAERADRARRQAAADADYVAWCAANPKAARSKWEFEDDNGTVWSMGSGGGGRRSYGRRSDMGNVDKGAYYSGYDAGDKISLDPQVDTGSRTKIGRSK